MGANVRRSSTLEAAEDHLELLDLSRSICPGDDIAQAYVRITRGCNKFCTYCVVPYTRGPEVHRPPRKHHRGSAPAGRRRAREVTLLGQTINHYAYEHGDGRKTTFAELLYQIHEAVPDLPRLRFVTSFPRDFTRRRPAGHARLPAHLPLPARPRPERQRPDPEADEPRLHRRRSTATSSTAPGR